MSLLSPVDIRRLADELGIRPTKTLGQNFLHDPNTIRKIVATSGATEGTRVVEIGPGLGSLTLGLLEVGARVEAIEIDTPLAQALMHTVDEKQPESLEHLRVRRIDALQIEELDTEPTMLVANLPYNVSVPVLLHFLATFPSIRSGLVLVQAEVAQRLCAAPGSKVYGVPSAKAAWFADLTLAGSVSRNVFWPVPNVDSLLVAFTRHDSPPPGDRQAVFDVVDAAFAQRRKTLRSALGSWLGSPQVAEEALVAAGIDPTLRGESLGIGDFAKITAALGGSDADARSRARG